MDEKEGGNQPGWGPGCEIPDRSSLPTGSFFAPLTGVLPLMTAFSAAC